MKTTAFGLALGLGLASLAPVAGAATLDGLSLSAEYRFPTVGETYPLALATGPFVVGPGADATIDVEDVTDLIFDFVGNMLTITFETVLSSPTWREMDFNGPVIDLLSPGRFTSFDWTGGSLGDISAGLSFTDSQLFINWAGLSYSDGATLTFDIGYEMAAVPVPAALPLLGAALGLLAMMRRRDRQG